MSIGVKSKANYWILPIFILFFLFGSIKSGYTFSMGYHYELIREAMRQVGFSKDAYSVALAGNSYVDIFQAEETEWLIDDDFCEVSKKLVDFLHFDNLYNKDLIDRYWRQLIHNTYNAVLDKVNKNDKLGLLLVMGVSLHIVEDFYAHSNWVELDLARYTGVKDPTYFDVIGKFPDKLERAIQENSIYGYKGLFTHWEGGLSHDALNKDHAGKPYFDWAYRSAYKACLEWLRLMRKWIVEDLRKEALWNELLRYEFREGNKGHLYTLTNFDEGTIRWMCTYGGAWKTSRRWSKTDVIADDMPNVPGIGVTEQASQDYPFLGIEWFSNCISIAKDMFEAKGVGRFVKLQSVEKLEEAIRKKQDFGEIVKVNYSEVSSLPPLDNNIIRDAINFLANSATDYDSTVQWLRVRIPEAQDLDTGAGWDNINNEEPGGTSDYWVMFIINNEEDHLYTEAEYTDESHPYPVWGVLKPLWDKKLVRIEVRMYESDCGLRGSQHKDEHMDIRPGYGKDFIFEFDPTNFSYNMPLGCKIWNIPRGFFIKSDGEGDLRARIYTKIWIMSDSKEENFYPVLYEHKEYDGISLPLLFSLPNLSTYKFNDRISSIWMPPSGWTIELYKDSNYKGDSLLVTNSSVNLYDIGWGDKISSIKVISRTSDFPPCPVLYVDKNFGGTPLQLPYSLPNLSTCGFYSDLSVYNLNDKVSSIWIPQGWMVEVYEHSHFEGRSLLLTNSVSDLHNIGWGDKISSVRIIPPSR